MNRPLSKEEFVELMLKNEELKKKRKWIIYLLGKAKNEGELNEFEEE